MRRHIPLLLAAVAAMVAAPVAAQDDRAAGLFTEARQLPLVGQSVVVRVHGGEARVQLDQVFANPGGELAQADYRLHLPSDAVVTGFGFWRDGRFLAAELRERGEARAAHSAAAGGGRATALLERDGTIHSFSVFPVAAGSLQEVSVTVVLPVITEGGRSHLRLPLDRFLGHARLSSGIVAHIETDEPLREAGVDGARFTERKRARRSATLVLSAAEPVELWWATRQPPLLVRADGVALDDGSTAVGLRLALHDPRSGRARIDEVVLVIDASYSLRRRAGALTELVTRVLDRAAAPVRVVAVAERTLEVTSGDRSELLARLGSGTAGHGARWADLEAAATAAGCDAPSRRCLVVTDPQLQGLPEERSLEVLLLADADELEHFDAVVGQSARVYQPGVDPAAALHALADELVLPVLELTAVRQDGVSLEPVGAPRCRVAAGGLLRVSFTTPSTSPLELELSVDGRPVTRTVEIAGLDPASRSGRALRRRIFSARLDDWTAAYRRTRDPELRRQIVDVSLREGIPTELTALHAASPDRVLSRTATPAPLLRRIGFALLLIGAVALLVARRPSP